MSQIASGGLCDRITIQKTQAKRERRGCRQARAEQEKEIRRKRFRKRKKRRWKSEKCLINSRLEARGRRKATVKVTFRKRWEVMSELGICITPLSERLRPTLASDGDLALKWVSKGFPALQVIREVRKKDGKATECGVWESPGGDFRGVSVKWNRREEAMKGKRRWRLYGGGEMYNREEIGDSMGQLSLFRDGKEISVGDYLVVDKSTSY